MISPIGNALIAATRELGEPSSSFQVEYSQRFDLSGQTVREIIVYPRGLGSWALVGQLLIILAGPMFLAMTAVASSQLAIAISLLVLVTGICIRLLHRRIGRRPAGSRTVFVSRDPV